MPNGIYPDQKVVTGGELVVNALPEAMFIACSVCIQSFAVFTTAVTAVCSALNALIVHLQLPFCPCCH